MKKRNWFCNMTGFLILILGVTGCSSEVTAPLRDAAVSATAAFIEQQTLDLLNGAFGTTAPP